MQNSTDCWFGRYLRGSGIEDSFKEWDGTESGVWATIMFEDGYVEIMPMAKLVKLYENRGKEKQKGTGLARIKSEI